MYIKGIIVEVGSNAAMANGIVQVQGQVKAVQIIWIEIIVIAAMEISEQIVTPTEAAVLLCKDQGLAVEAEEEDK